MQKYVRMIEKALKHIYIEVRGERLVLRHDAQTSKLVSQPVCAVSHIEFKVLGGFLPVL